MGIDFALNFVLDADKQVVHLRAGEPGVLDKAETPGGKGLWFMDTSSAAAEAVTLWAAAQNEHILG